MPVYRLHLVGASHEAADDETVSVPTLNDVKLLARTVAQELGRNRPPDELKGQAISVRIPGGDEVYRVRLVSSGAPAIRKRE
jgi:hypothetical protein